MPDDSTGHGSSNGRPVQRFLSLTPNFRVAVTDGRAKRCDDAGAANAAVPSNLIADLVGSFCPDFFMTVVQCVHERVHDLRMTAAVEVVAQMMNGVISLLGVAGCHRFVDQLRNLTTANTTVAG